MVEPDHRTIYRGVFTCTSIGHFRLTRLESNEAATAALPVRLRDLKMSCSGGNFAYGGDEVDLSVWNTERALSGPSVSSLSDTAQAGQKRKKSRPALLYGEVWRSKNVSTVLYNICQPSLTLCGQVANDHLSLRHPVNIASLAFLSEGQGNHHHLAIGNELGSVRRYDTRASKQPVADWLGISKVGGVRRIEKGSREQYVSRFFHAQVVIEKGYSELFAADSTTNLLCLDLRNGRVLYGYQGKCSIKPLTGAYDPQVCPVPLIHSQQRIATFPCWLQRRWTDTSDYIVPYLSLMKRVENLITKDT